MYVFISNYFIIVSALPHLLVYNISKTNDNLVVGVCSDVIDMKFYRFD